MQVFYVLLLDLLNKTQNLASFLIILESKEVKKYNYIDVINYLHKKGRFYED